MGTFKVNELENVDSWVESDDRLWLSADGTLVGEGDPSAASLFAVPGQRISREDAERYGLVKASKAAKVVVSEDEEPAAKKERAKAEDKQRAKPGSKAV